MAKKAKPPFSAGKLTRLEREYPQGLTTFQIIELLEQRGVHLTEANLRKYVQLGLLPQSRLVGNGPGPHRGTHGLYPTFIVRFILKIRALQTAGHTFAEITPHLRGEVDLALLDASMERTLATPPYATTPESQRVWSEMRRDGRELRARLRRLHRALHPVPATSPATG